MLEVTGLKMDLKNREKWVAIIGSRKANEKELQMAYAFGRRCAKDGKIVVSGLALGIDSAAHKGAIDAGGKTIALVSTPSSMPIYPAENNLLAKNIEQNGCIIYPYKKKPLFVKNGISTKAKRLIERSILNAYTCPNIVIVKESSSMIIGGTKWAANYGKEIGHSVYRLGTDKKFYKDPESEESRILWISEMDIKQVLLDMDNYNKELLE